MYSVYAESMQLSIAVLRKREDFMLWLNDFSGDLPPPTCMDTPTTVTCVNNIRHVHVHDMLIQQLISTSNCNIKIMMTFHFVFVAMAIYSNHMTSWWFVAHLTNLMEHREAAEHKINPEFKGPLMKTANRYQ